MAKPSPADINAGVDVATPIMDKMIENMAGMFAGAVEQQLASEEGVRAIVQIVEAVITTDRARVAAAAAGKATP